MTDYRESFITAVVEFEICITATTYVMINRVTTGLPLYMLGRCKTITYGATNIKL